MPETAPEVRNGDALLLEYLRHLERRRFGRRAVWLHLSELQAGNRRHQHVRAATSGFDALVDGGAAQVFVLADTDVVLVYQNDVHEHVRTEVEGIMFLFGDDPLIVRDEGRWRFATWYDMESEYDAFLRAIRRRLSDPPALEDGRAASDVDTKIAHRQRTGEALTPAMLERIEAVLASADLSSLVRQRTACRVSPELAVEPHFTEVFVSIAELRDTVLPDADLLSNPWLFRRLTETLDRRVLSYLTGAEQSFEFKRISLNVNVSTLLSHALVALDKGLNGAAPSSIAFEVRAVDVFLDVAAFLFACGFARQKGYRIFLDGLRWRDVAVLRTDRLGIDLAKVQWDPAFAERDSAAATSLRRLVARDGAEAVMLCHVESRAAVEAGQALGVRLFQGAFIDQLCREDGRRQHLSKLKRVGVRDT